MAGRAQTTSSIERGDSRREGPGVPYLRAAFYVPELRLVIDNP